MSSYILCTFCLASRQRSRFQLRWHRTRPVSRNVQPIYSSALLWWRDLVAYRGVPEGAISTRETQRWPDGGRLAMRPIFVPPSASRPSLSSLCDHPR